VAHGTYRPDREASSAGRAPDTIMASGDRTATFELVYNVTFRGGYAGYGEPDPDARDFDRYETILSGDLGADDIQVDSLRDMLTEPSRAENSYHVVTVAGTAILDGFTITGGNAVDQEGCGGGLLNRYGIPQVINCIITRNAASGNGGGMYNDLANPILVNCTFTDNYAEDSGGAMGNSRSAPDLANCTFSHNAALYGGGAMHNDVDSKPNMLNCVFIENTSRYGGAMFNFGSAPVLANCAFYRNRGSDYGAGMYNSFGSDLVLKNCIFVANQAGAYGAGMSSNGCDLRLTNCTFASNSAQNGNALAFSGGQSDVELRSCIIWDGAVPAWIRDHSEIDMLYSNVSGGWPGEGNVDANPQFVDADGPDNIPGTEDDDLRLTLLSPCVNTGDPDYTPGMGETDIGGNGRIAGGRVDMGAYEFQWEIYVDDDAPGDLGPNDPSISDPLEDGTEAHPFDTIQEAIDVAEDGHKVLVLAGLYSNIDYRGKAITVVGADGAAVIEASSLGQPGDGVTFHTGEGPGSVLRNFIIRNKSMAISLNYGSSPTISNLTIVDNDFGIAAYENSDPDISNCIFWNNRDGDLFQCDASYSCIESGAPGQGNISVDPLFVDPANGDYHLRSQGWHWNIRDESWAYDNYVTSPCIDAGDPASPLYDELITMPRDLDGVYGINRRINMGAFGGTPQASIPPPNWTVPEK
ncbi:MAG: right-handed parallel beta-helix repeat-containing protein, partial [Phycisphaerales bacterium]